MKAKPLALLAVLIVSTMMTVPASAQEDGRGVYDQTCTTCHQSTGLGIPGSFPPLVGNENATDLDYVIEVIRNGRTGELTANGEVFNERMDPVTGLSDEQIEAVAAYVVGLAGAVAEIPDQPAEGELPVGDPAMGADLFTGSERFANGAPACSACHSAASSNLLGGPGLGPDLTGLFSRFGGEAGTTAAISNPPSATMRPVFSEHPLTDGEVAHLAAYFEDIDGEPQSGGPDWFAFSGLGGLAALLGFLAIFVRKPHGTYVDKLRGGTR